MYALQRPAGKPLRGRLGQHLPWLYPAPDSVSKGMGQGRKSKTGSTVSSATLGCIHDCLCCVQDTATRCQLSGRYQCLGCCHFLYNQPNLPRTTEPLQQHWGPRYVVSPSPFWKLPFLPCLHHFRSERQSHCLSAFCSGFRSFNPLERRGLKMIFL